MFFQVLQVSGVFFVRMYVWKWTYAIASKHMPIDSKITSYVNCIFALLQSIPFTLFCFDKILWFEKNLALIFNAIKHVREYTGATCHV